MTMASFNGKAPASRRPATTLSSRMGSERNQPFFIIKVSTGCGRICGTLDLRSISADRESTGKSASGNNSVLTDGLRAQPAILYYKGFNGMRKDLRNSGPSIDKCRSGKHRQVGVRQQLCPHGWAQSATSHSLL